MSSKNIKQKVVKCLQQEENVIFAYLFGSYARKEQHPFSDIDIAVYLKKYTHDEYLRLFRILARELDFDFDLVILNKAPPLLRHKVISEGILLFCEDLNVHYNFVFRTLVEALDFKETYNIIINEYRKFLHAR